MTSIFSKHARDGFGLLETVIGAAIISIVLIGLVEVGRFTFALVDTSNFKIRSAFLAEEGIEAIRTLRDASWATNIVPVTLDTDYYFSFSGGAWHLSSVYGSLIDTAFSRTVRFSAVCRDVLDKITTCGAPTDPNARAIAVSVGWVYRGRAGTTTIATYLTNIFEN
jgi:Tfp pilus assembly protein PilV